VPLGFARFGGQRQLRECNLRNDSESLTGVFFVFILQGPGELLVSLIGDDGEPIDLRVMDPLTSLIDRQSQTATDFLALTVSRSRIVQRADLEYVRVVQPSRSAE